MVLNIHMSLFLGAVQLDDLILKKDVFNQFGLPLQLKKGLLFIFLSMNSLFYCFIGSYELSVNC